MRFVWAVAAFVLAALLIGAGIAQRTVFQGPKSETASISASEAAPFLLIDAEVLNQLPAAKLRAQGEGDIFAAYGRTADMEAWLSDKTYNAASVEDGEIVVEAVTPPLMAVGDADGGAQGDAEDPAAASEDTAAEPAEEEIPAHSPVGSDLWLDEFQESDVLIAPLELRPDMSVLIAADGAEPAPADVSVTWPITSTTPWAGPLIAGGALLMAVGAVLYLLGIRHARRSRGPRRKGIPVPVTEPIDLSVTGADKGVISATSGGRRAVSSGRRAFAVLPVVAISALLFTGCSANYWPQMGASPTPSPTASVIVPEGQQAPAVTKAQAERILARIASTAAEADELRDEALAATRLDGAVLATRSTNYALRGAIADYRTPRPILSKPLEIVLPQSYDGWPRSVMAVVDDEETKTSSIMVLTQQDAWSPYKLTYQANLEASTLMPDLAPVYIGATQVPPDSSFLVMPPQQVAAAYADILNKGEESEFADMFDAEGDDLRESIAADRQRRLTEFNQTAATTGSLTFASTPGAQDPFALLTLEGGAIVAVNVDETDTVTPTNADAVIKLENNPTVKTLAGADQSATGFSTTFTDQIFFYVPAQGSNEKIRLLGYSTDILNAKVIK